MCLRGFIILAMFFSMSLLYLDIGYSIHDETYGRIPFTMTILGVMSFLMYLIVTDTNYNTRYDHSKDNESKD
jgi:hypothetical protein